MREPARESADLQTERLATQQQQQQSCQCECGRVRSYHYQLASWTGPKNSSGALQNATDQLDYWSALQYRPSIQEKYCCQLVLGMHQSISVRTTYYCIIH
jgi:hypothetical protein